VLDPLKVSRACRSTQIAKTLRNEKEERGPMRPLTYSSPGLIDRMV